MVSVSHWCPWIFRGPGSRFTRMIVGLPGSWSIYVLGPPRSWSAWILVYLCPWSPRSWSGWILVYLCPWSPQVVVWLDPGLSMSLVPPGHGLPGSWSIYVLGPPGRGLAGSWSIYVLGPPRSWSGWILVYLCPWPPQVMVCLDPGLSVSLVPWVLGGCGCVSTVAGAVT